MLKSGTSPLDSFQLAAVLVETLAPEMDLAVDGEECKDRSFKSTAKGTSDWSHVADTYID
jgi:hypothetical protein